MFAYAIINKVSSECCQVITSSLKNWKLDNERDFSVSVPVEKCNIFNGKFYYDGKWWERIYNRYETIIEKDEQGNVISETVVPLEEYGYVDNELNL